MNNIEEKDRIDKVATWFSTKKTFNSTIAEYTAKVIIPFCKGSILEIGCADGYITEIISNKFPHVHAVDGSEELIKKAKQNIKNVDFFCSMLEDFNPSKKYDTIIITHVLEHVIDPLLILKKCKEWLEYNGTLIVCVPNAYSLHRRIGKEIGNIQQLTDLSETDVKIGHRRVYTPMLLIQDIKTSGFYVELFGGFLLKPRPSIEMESWDKKILDALFKIGMEIPEYSSEIYVICKKG